MENKNYLVFDNPNNIYNNKSSLQDNFQNFMKIRKQLRKICNNETSKEIKVKPYRNDEEKIKSLRKKFVSQAISYLGVPYAKKYLEESHPLFNSPIFLDCCGLVRQCLNDLSEDFGFVLGRWNQAYQFDILPDNIDFTQMEEGDLIFYEATFYKHKNWKLQPHDLVHVEIFLGGKDTPERTIAARDRFGVVEYNDTYQFTSENYYDIKYHFKSINTWLRGVHTSFCKDHKWHDDFLDNKPNKFSLFSLDAEQENKYD
jgi:hypothetical protein